jgi:16S rRNA (cytosine967-C5)-methyltransferase
LLAPQPGHQVLDACAAPGGKTCHILESTPMIAGLTAIDIDARRLARLESNLDRLGLEARIRVGNAAAPGGDWAQPSYYARILLDVPCSATGVIRRHPDIKWLRRPEDIEALIPLQAKMLDAMWPLLSAGGMLLYSTCSLIPEENEYQIQAFLGRTPDATERPIVSDWGHARSFGRQTLPGEQEMDGFYYACLEKA